MISAMISAGARLTVDAAGAARGTWRLLGLDPDWAEGFDLTTGGFLRSFWAPLLALPLDLLATQAIERAQAAGGAAVRPEAPAASVLAHLVDALGYPLLIALIARPLGIARGYAAFVTVTNWASLFLSLGVAVAALPVLVVGPAALGPFSLAALVGVCASLILVWRAARETLSRELAPVLLVVLLSMGVDALAGRLAQALSP